MPLFVICVVKTSDFCTVREDLSVSPGWLLPALPAEGSLMVDGMSSNYNHLIQKRLNR